MKSVVWLLKKSEVLSAASIRLVYLTGKSKVPLHPKHLIRSDLGLYKELMGKNKTVLDIGCGPGQHSLMVAPKVKKVVGIDKDKSSLEIAKKAAVLKRIKNIEFKEANVEGRLEFKVGSFDSVIMIDVLEHIIKRQNLLKEVKRILRSSGKVLVVIPNKNTDWKRIQRKYSIESFSDPDHKIEYSKESIKKELEKAGFKVEEIEPIGYDTPLVGFIDLVGGVSIPLYKYLSERKQYLAIKKPQNCSGFKIIAVKK